jgi:quercetin dioxygenase-like cupin family protein
VSARCATRSSNDESGEGSNEEEADMKVVEGGDRNSLGYGGRFTGEVELEMLHATPADDDPDTALVHFHHGAVTYWHSHPGGQQLYVVDGDARVGTEAEGEAALGVGALVVCPPGERHWHGAAPGAEATLLAVTWGTTAWETVAPE